MAHAAEVSRATVTNALNGTGRMGEATRTRVRAIAADLGYRTPARTLALGITLRTGHAWDFTAVPYYERIITSALLAAHRHGYGLTVLPSADRAWDNLIADGVLILDPPQDDPISARIADAHTPITFVGRPDHNRAPQSWVDNDHRTSVREVLDHLAAQGARRIALVASGTTDYYTRACVAAYRDWCREHRRHRRIDLMTPGWAPEDSLLAGPDRPDAVYGIYEPVGHALLAAARRLELRVPRDLMIAGFGEALSYASTDPPVTTVSHAPTAGGRAAVESLIALVESGARIPATLIPARLHVRASTLRRGWLRTTPRP